MSDQLRLFDGESGAPIGEGFADPADRDARRFAVDPRNDVVLEASAGTGKTRVLVERYLNLLDADVQPANILAITFTRKAAAEMHERIVRRLREDAKLSDHHRRRWLALRDRLGEIAISTIDAFCLSLLREFPLEAGLDPGFDVADETEVPRLVELAIDRTLRVALGLAPRDADLALVLAQLGTWRARIGLSQLLERRLVARGALDRFLARGPRDLTIETACARVVDSLRGLLETMPDGLPAFVANGPVRHPTFQLLAQSMRRLPELRPSDAAAVRSAVERVRDHFLTQDGRPRSDHALHPYKVDDCDSPDGWRRHRRLVADRAPRVRDVLAAFDRDLNALLARGVRKLFAIAETEYRRALAERSVLDFSDLLDRALALLRQMDEFAQSRFRLESRYHHVLVDEFQDTSRAQWELVDLLIRSWGEGFGLVHDAPLPPSIFVVGDRKQSIYRFRDAEVTVLEEAAGVIAALRPGVSPRRSIRQSLRAGPGLLAFVNDVFEAVEKRERRDAFQYVESDRFPIGEETPLGGGSVDPILGLAAAEDPRRCAAAVADEIARLCRDGQVPDRDTGLTRPVRPSDIAILFRSRVSHREFEEELERRGVATYVYKGLGFFDADEIKDLSALLRFLAEPASDLRAAALLRSRLVRVSDAGLTELAPDLAAALTSPGPPPALETLTAEDRAVLELARSSVRTWLARVDRVPPADLIDEMLAESAYAFELRGPRRLQAWENLKKLRALIRRIQNRGYATLAHIAAHLDCLRAGDESNAVIEAIEAVNLMTVHAAKGLEFPIVFVVNLAKGVGAIPPPLRVVEESGQAPVVAVDRYVPEAEEHEKAADLEETKRLLYVAFTRARNRLYLATVLKDGRFNAGPGSLGAILPATLRAALEQAGPDAAAAIVTWLGPSGRPHQMRVCRAAGAPERPARAAEAAGARAIDFDPILADATETARVTSVTGAAATSGREAESADRRAARLVGTFVHRLMRYGVPYEDPGALRQRAAALVRPDESETVHDLAPIIAGAAETYAGLRAREDVRALFASGEALFEIPFSWRLDDTTLLRGVIDCVVARPDGSLVVVDFKTGRADPGHQAQLDAYVRAVESLYPGHRVEGVLVYTG